MNRNWLAAFSVSLYVLFFAIAFWSALPPSVTGSMAGPSGLVESQLATCGLDVGTAAGQEVSQFPPKQETERFTGETYTGWISPGNETIYHCALQTGAMFN